LNEVLHHFNTIQNRVEYLNAASIEASEERGLLKERLALKSSELEKRNAHVSERIKILWVL